MPHEINNIGITLLRIKLVFYGRDFLEKIFEPPSQGTGSTRAFVASNSTGWGHRVPLKKSCLTQLTSHSNLLSPFPFRSTNHSGADALHHKTRRTSTRTRTGLHRSLTTIPSRILLENRGTRSLFLTRTPKDNTTLTMRQNTRCQHALV